MDQVAIVAVGCLLLALLGWAAWGDIRSRTIPNQLNAAIALLAPAWWWAHALPLWPSVTVQVGLALIVFLLFAAAFAMNLMGGGDVKMIGALALWLDAEALVRMLVVMAIAGGVLTLGMVVLHRLRRAEGTPEIPYGVAIAVAGGAVVTNDILTNLLQ